MDNMQFLSECVADEHATPEQFWVEIEEMINEGQINEAHVYYLDYVKQGFKR